MKVIDVLGLADRKDEIVVSLPIDAGVGELIGVEILRVTEKEQFRPEFMEWLSALSLDVWKISADVGTLRIDCKPKKFQGTADICKREEPAADPEETQAEEKTENAPAQKPTTPLYSRICTVCGKEFKAKSGATKVCPDCKATGRKSNKAVKDFAAELLEAEE